MDYTPKQRMLNAYRGRFSDRYAVAPEFWYYYPAKVLGVDMIQFEREIPLWKALQTTFTKYRTEGWGIAWAESRNPHAEGSSSFDRIPGSTQYRLRTTLKIEGKEFVNSRVYDQVEPSWSEEHFVKREEDAAVFMAASLRPDVTFDFAEVNKAYESVGEDYLLEFVLGGTFFDFITGFMGFESAMYYVMGQDPAEVESFQKRYIEFNLEAVRKACRETKYESFFIGCSYSCNSLIGPNLWRQWDKPYIKAMADELHKQGKLLHIHFHGRCMETVADFAELGIDCVCPFERPPGGDVDGLADLKKVRKILGDRVTLNGNVHTVETLIRGTPQQVREEVRQIKEAYSGSPRLIIGTGDQVGRETPEENILAMIEEAKR
jgi:hypothetical protein